MVYVDNKYGHESERSRQNTKNFRSSWWQVNIAKQSNKLDAVRRSKYERNISGSKRKKRQSGWDQISIY